jgi:hypothetical protein
MFHPHCLTRADKGAPVDVGATGQSAATNAELRERIAELVTLVEELVASRTLQAPIEQAKGIIMACYKIDEDAAFELLRRRSQWRSSRLADVAADVVRENATPRATPVSASAMASTARRRRAGRTTHGRRRRPPTR